MGHWPLGPGTLASALVTLVWRLAPWPWSLWLALAVVITIAGTAAAGRAEPALGHDDSRIVIDEAAGMAIALLAAQRTWAGAGAAFLLFRFFDIVKPWPLGRLQRIPGGRGIMLDDLAAGAAAALLLLIVAALRGA